MHVALGWEYRARRVSQGPVIYVACEGEQGLSARIEAFRQEKLQETGTGIPFFLVTTRLDLAAEAVQLVQDIQAQVGSTEPVAIVVDTLNRSLAGSESKDEDMAAYVAGADHLRAAFGAAVILIHHCGINDARPRGHSSLTGAADAQLAVKRDTAGQVVLAVEWMKDGPEGDVLTSRLKILELGFDEDGEAVSSCVVEPGIGSADNGAVEKLTPTARLALETLHECTARQGVAASFSSYIPTGAVVVGLEVWRDALRARDILPDDKNARMAWKRIKERLLIAGKVGIHNDQVWAVQRHTERNIPDVTLPPDDDPDLPWNPHPA